MHIRIPTIGLLLLISAWPVFFLEAHEEDSLVLQELQALSANVKRLEEKVQELEGLLIAGLVQENGTGKVANESDTLVTQVVNAVNRQAEYINFPWMENEKWKGLKEGMSPEEVKEVIGEPTLEDPSLHKRIDFVYTYRGRRPANGEKVVGKVKFYRNKVVEIEVPE